MTVMAKNPDPMPAMTGWELARWTETLMAVTECDDQGKPSHSTAVAWQAERAVRDARRGRT